MKRNIITIGTICVLFVFSGCRHTFTHYEEITSLISSENYMMAAQKVEEQKEKAYSKNERLLYYLDLGILYHLAGEYEKSNEFFEKAESTVDELFTKSISKEAASLLTSDYARPYDGEVFERVLINVIRALNYLFLNQPDEALVEARKVDHKLGVYKEAYKGKLTYSEDAFVRYLMGMIYENSGELNDAFISYRNALYSYKAYEANYNTPTPPELYGDVVRVAKALGFNDEIEELKKDFAEIKLKERKIPKGHGEIVLIHMNGLAPKKTEYTIQVAYGNGLVYVRSSDVSTDEQADVNKAMNLAGSIAADVNVSIAFPKFEKRPFRIKSSSIEIEGIDRTVETHLAENVEDIAIKDMEDKIGRIYARTVARAIIKYTLAYAGGAGAGKVAEEFGGKMAGKITGFLAKKAFAAAASATEEADKRSWQILPAQFRVGRVILPEGSYTINLILKDQYGNTVGRKTFRDVNVKSGKKTFLRVSTVW
jgi:hypothetical protein